MDVPITFRKVETLFHFTDIMDFDRKKLNRIDSELERSQSWLQQVEAQMQGLNAPATAPPSHPSPRKSVLFYRDYGGLTGGHLKVWDYFNHILHSEGYQPQIYFSPQSAIDTNNPWFHTPKDLILSEPLSQPYIIFMEGFDWLLLDETQRQNSPVPIINLIQHVRHAYPDNPRYPFLRHKAIRICVSPEVGTYLTESRQVNGPVFVIPNGLDQNGFPEAAPDSERDVEILIAASKEPQLGEQLRQRLQAMGYGVQLLQSQLPRSDYLKYLNRAKITVFLPNRQEGEGFYLPALEGMALGTLTICPDCIGNRSFCLPGYNCLRPEYTVEGILDAVFEALKFPPVRSRLMRTAASQTAAEHSLNKERTAFLEILNNIHTLW